MSGHAHARGKFSDLYAELAPSAPPTAHEVAVVRRVVAGAARDAADCAQLLDALGLLDLSDHVGPRDLTA